MIQLMSIAISLINLVKINIQRLEDKVVIVTILVVFLILIKEHIVLMKWMYD